MSTIQAPAIHDLFAGSFAALTPAAADVDRPRLLRRLKQAARAGNDAGDPLVEHLRREGFRESNIIPYTHRPFDTRWLYVDPSADRAYLDHVAAGVDFIGVASESDGPVVTRRAATETDGPLRLFPFVTVSTRNGATVKTPNLTKEARTIVTHNAITESDLFHHVVALLAAHSAAGARVHVPENRETLNGSATLGRRVVSIFAEHDPLISHGDPALRAFGVPSRIGKEARMLRGSVLAVDERWAESEMLMTRPFRADEVNALNQHGAEALELLGNRTCDVYLNERAFFSNVPVNVWRYAHRGVPLLRGWLRDRHVGMLGRPLLREEATHFAMAVRRITELLLLAPALARSAAAA